MRRGVRTRTNCILNEVHASVLLVHPCGHEVTGLEPVEVQNARSSPACVACLPSTHLALIEPSPNLRFGPGRLTGATSRRGHFRLEALPENYVRNRNSMAMNSRPR